MKLLFRFVQEYLKSIKEKKKKSNILNKIFILQFILFIPAVPIYSLSEVYLNDGSVLKGQIIFQTNDSINIEVNFNVMNIYKSNIQKINNPLELLFGADRYLQGHNARPQIGLNAF